MKFVVDPEADEEISEATRYLAQQSDRIAAGFLEDLSAAREQLRQFPHSGTSAGKHVRRLMLSRYPYQLIYRVEHGAIRIFAVAHLKRRPGYWRRRVRPE